jgi:hypothetical protein
MRRVIQGVCVALVQAAVVAGAGPTSTNWPRASRIGGTCDSCRTAADHATCDALPHGDTRGHGSSAASARTSRDISALNAR